MEDRIGERLRDLAEDAPTARSLPPEVRRRARRRASVTLVAGAVAVAAVAVGVSEGLEAITRREVQPGQQPRSSAFERARGWIAVGGAGITAVDPSDPSNRVVLTRRPRAFDHPLAWSPDGTTLLFRSDTAPGGDFEDNLLVLHADGTVVQLTTGGGVVSASFSPDGSHVVFSRWLHRDGLFVVPVDGGAPRRIDDAGEEPASAYPAWSPDGELVAYIGEFRAGGDDAPALAWISPDGTGEGSVLGDPFLEEVEAETTGLAWSPDGTRLAFAGTSETGHSAVYIVEADGTRLREIVGGDDARYGWPTWSPDGSRIAFVRDGRVLSVNLDGTGLREVATAPADGRIAWNPVAA